MTVGVQLPPWPVRRARGGAGAPLVLPLLASALSWAVQRRRRVRRLRSLLADERALTATLVNRVAELDLLVEASRAMNSSLQLDQTLGLILDAACGLLRATEGSIQLVPADASDQLEVVAVHGAATARPGQRQRIGDGLAGRVALGTEPLMVDGPHTRGPAAARFGCALVVPLRHRNELVGVLNVAVAADRPPFSEFDLRSATVVAETAAAAICNARLLQATRDSVTALTELDRLKDEFLTLVTHELRTPLTSVIGLAQTIARGHDRMDGQRVAELARLIGTQGWRLDRLVDDLLRTSQLQQGRAALQPQCLDVAALVRDAVTSLHAGTDVHMIVVDLPDRLDWFVDGDALARIVVNLVGNALKYTPAGSTITVRSSCSATELSLVVEDDGPGIPDAERAVVFEKFRRGEGLGSGGGLGLGLYLVRALAESSGGAVTLDGREGGGCRFLVTLPARSPD